VIKKIWNEKFKENLSSVLSSIQYDTIDQKQLEDVESFKHLGIMLTNDGRCSCEINSRIAVAKAAFNKKRALFTGNMELELRKKLVKCYIWSIALHGAETCTLRAVDQKHLKSF
jgi:hypothetical protein